MIAEKPGIGATGLVTQATRLNFTSLTTIVPMIIVVRRGRKVIQSPGHEFVMESGEAIAIAQGQVFDFENIPADDGDYEARWLTIEPSVIEAFGDPGDTLPVMHARQLGTMGEGLTHAFEQAVEALLDDGSLPDVVIRHRVMELLAWLSSEGLRFSLHQPTSFTARIRRLVGHRPEHPWSSGEISRALGVSDATLRRRLHDESSNLRGVLTDIRMTHAMSLLQSSEMPVSLIAASAGFESQSRFAIRFRHRFGFSPSAIRGHNRLSPDRQGARPAG
ncbi:helix-turn-helix transcriptional regulator [Rhizobium setariae]|nr:AraC family transcriptional regulator [Rhizobium setariae]